MSSNAEIFITPGQWLFNFFLSCIGWHPAQIDPSFYFIFSALFALCFWVSIARVFFEIIKKMTGLGQPRRY